jgi:uncharacterized protein
MMLDLSSVINFEGKELCVEENLDFSNIDVFGFAFAQPVKVWGKIVNIGGSLELSCKALANLTCVCDRCLEPFDMETECRIEEIFKKEDANDQGEKNPDVIYFKGTSVDFDEVVLNNIVLQMPTKLICSNDCKGLCSKCGQNLNHGECKCDTRAEDPRFDILDKFFK